MDLNLPLQLFFMLLAGGLLLVGIEIFVPGGILGAIGGLLLVGAIVTGFFAFPDYGPFVAVGIILLAGIFLAAWIKFFPETWIGKQMTVARDMKTYKATQDGVEEFRGKEGQAASDLRPGGFATINGKRVDVITQGEMISKGAKIRVAKVEGNRIVVEESSFNH